VTDKVRPATLLGQGAGRERDADSVSDQNTAPITHARYTPRPDLLFWRGPVFDSQRRLMLTVRHLRFPRPNLIIVDVEPGAQEFAARYLPKPSHRMCRHSLRYSDDEPVFSRWFYRRGVKR
jgi:hypothetical protein